MDVPSKDGTETKNLELDHSWLGRHQSRWGGRTLTWHETGTLAAGQEGTLCVRAKSQRSPGVPSREMEALR